MQTARAEAAQPLTVLTHPLPQSRHRRYKLEMSISYPTGRQLTLLLEDSWFRPEEETKLDSRLKPVLRFF